MPPRISVFPKCYFDELTIGRMSFAGWIRDAARLGGEGLEHYDGFFRSLLPADVDPIARALDDTEQITSMICFSPDFTHPDPAERRRQVERQKAAVDLTVRLGARHCRTLSGQRYPGLTRAEGIARTLDGIRRSLEYAERRGVVLCMENHYKDGTWRYPEFAQPEDIFLEIVEQVDSPFFGVQYDPSNAVVGGYDPIRFLEKVRQRVVTMHASVRARSQVSGSVDGVGLAVHVSGVTHLSRSEMGSTLSFSPARIRGPACRHQGGSAGWPHEARELSQPAALLRNALAGRRVRHSHGTTAPRPSGHPDDDDLPARDGPWGAGRDPSALWLV